jgi:DNA helicase II / ATP-dependent DNA helicase PcrA
MNIISEYCRLRDRIIEIQFEHLDEAQKKAVFNQDRNVLVLACPGSGKTTVLINKVLYLTRYGKVYNSSFTPEDLKAGDLELLNSYIEGKKNLLIKSDQARVQYLLGFRRVNPNNIVVITFTKAAAANMKERYKMLSKSADTPFFGTFHGLFYKLLIRHYGNIKIIEVSEAYRILSNTLVNYMDEVSDDKIKDIRSRISLFKCSEASLEDFDSHISKDIFVSCYNTYENYKKERGLLDFDDIQIKFKELLVKNNNIAEMYRKGFKYMLLDEFQDSDNIQLQVIKELNKYNSLFGVGDEDQCIYSFRGSRPDYMVDFQKYFKNGVKLQLSTNYRSAENIVSIAGSLIKNNVKRNEKSMKAFKKVKKQVEVSGYYDENSQAEDIALRIEKLSALGNYEYKDCSVLYRTNLESRSLIDAFIRKKIPFKLLDKEYNFFDHFICRDLAAYLKLSISNDDMDSFRRVINKPFRYVSRVSLEKLSCSSIKGSCFDFMKSLQEIPVFQIKTLDKLQKDIHGLNKMSLQGAIANIINNLGYHDYIKEYSQKFKIQISELEDILEEFKEAAASYNTIITFLSHIEQVGQEIHKSTEKNKDDNRVTLSTIHGVKGMEFKNVFIINCVEEILPHINNIEEDIEEERRLFFVAVTRAIDNLFMCIPRNFRGKYKPSSRFVEECSINLSENMESIYKAGVEVIHNSFGKGKIIDINKNVIEIKFEGDISRKFDIAVLHNQGIIKKLS